MAVTSASTSGPSSASNAVWVPSSAVESPCTRRRRSAGSRGLGTRSSWGRLASDARAGGQMVGAQSLRREGSSTVTAMAHYGVEEGDQHTSWRPSRPD